MNDPLVEIVGGSGRSSQARGLVLCDPGDPRDGWTLVAVLPDPMRPAPELRFFPNGGLGRVAGLEAGYVLQMTTRERAETEHADLLSLIRMLPQAVAALDGASELLEPDEVIAIDELDEGTGPIELDEEDEAVEPAGLVSRASAWWRSMFAPRPPAAVPSAAPRRLRAGPVSVELLAAPLPSVTEPELRAPASER